MKYAPYARQVVAEQRAGRAPNVYCFAGSNGWNLAEHRRKTHGEGTALVLPAGEDPTLYMWPRLDAVVAIPGDCDGAQFRALVHCLLSSGCRCIAELRPDRPAVFHYARAEHAQGVAA